MGKLDDKCIVQRQYIAYIALNVEHVQVSAAVSG